MLGLAHGFALRGAQAFVVLDYCDKLPLHNYRRNHNNLAKGANKAD